MIVDKASKVSAFRTTTLRTKEVGAYICIDPNSDRHSESVVVRVHNQIMHAEDLRQAAKALNILAAQLEARTAARG